MPWEGFIRSTGGPLRRAIVFFALHRLKPGRLYRRLAARRVR